MPERNPLVGEVLIFLGYRAQEDGDVFRRGDRCVVAAINPDGGAQCFPCNGRYITAVEGDTLFPGEYLRTSPAKLMSLPFPWNTVQPARALHHDLMEADFASA